MKGKNKTSAEKFLECAASVHHYIASSETELWSNSSVGQKMITDELSERLTGYLRQNETPEEIACSLDKTGIHDTCNENT